MRERLFAILICAVLSVTGCSAGTPDSVASERIQNEVKKAEASKTKEEKEKKEESDKADSKDTAEAGKEKSAEKTSKETRASEQKKTEEKKAEEKSAEKTSKETAAAEQKKTEEKKTEEKSEEKDTEKEESKEKEETKKTEETKKKEKDKKQESKEKYANDYIPDGFTPYGNYVLVYDSGYEVKTRLSKAGLTYYYGSEEFLFTLDKNLPDMTREVAHILFNTAGPMDPADTGGEEFPFWEGYVIYINLDDGSYYEVPSYSLDLNGRVFARDLFETFRQKWEGKF